MIDLSIIIPVYKAEKYIHQCVDSIIREAPKNSEIILVDDGSPDLCPTICDEYARKDKRIKVLHKLNSGLSGARNAGLEVALGKYLFFIDSDDYVKTNYFRSLFLYDADVVISSFVAYYTNRNPEYSLNLNGKKYSSIKEFLQDFNKYYPVTFNTVWGKLYRRDIIIGNNIRFREDLFMVEDILFNMEYYNHCSTIVYEPEAVLMYRQGDGTLSKKSNDKLFIWYQESYSKLKSMLEQYNVLLNENEKIYYRSLFGNTIECLTNTVRGNGKKLNELCSLICKNQDVVKSTDYCNSYKTRLIAFAIKKKNKKMIKVSTRAYVLALSTKAMWRKRH